MSFPFASSIFTFKHKVSADSRAANALSQKFILFTNIHAEVVGFNTFGDLYLKERDFGLISAKKETILCMMVFTYRILVFQGNRLLQSCCT